jgi:cell division protein ZipA
VTELRWALLLLAAGILAGVFLWTRYAPRLRARRRDAAVRGAAAADPPLEAPAPPPPRARPVVLPDKVVTLRLMCRTRPGFPGEDLVMALREAGLRHGRFGIFHLPVDQDPDTAMFSVASLVEPGSFDLTRLRTDHYPGVSLFLAIPGPPDPVAAFDAMIDTARTLAESLGGELLDEQGSTLSIQRQRYIREEIIQFLHRQPRPA